MLRSCVGYRRRSFPVRCSLLQRARQVEVGDRIENLRQEYTSFMYGFEAVGGGAVPTDLSTNSSGLFQTVELANMFFR